MDRLKIDVATEDHTVIVTLTGDAGVHHLDALRTQIDQLLKRREARLIVDLTGLQFIASTGLGELVRLALSVRGRAAQFRVCGAHNGIETAIVKSRLNELLPLYRNVEHARQP